MNNLQKHKVEIRSDGECIAKIEMEADMFFQKAAIGQEMYGKVYLALIEASENAFRHGNKQDSDKKIIVSFEKSATQIVIQITDSGDGFNYREVPNPLLPENIENPNGRGLFIISNLSDKVEFNELGNEIKMTFNIE